MNYNGNEIKYDQWKEICSHFGYDYLNTIIAGVSADIIRVQKSSIFNDQLSNKENNSLMQEEKGPSKNMYIIKIFKITGEYD